MNMMPIPQNYKNSVDWILGAYTDAGVTFTNGFQKDAIQNAVGARKTNKWKNWQCDISYKQNACGTFVVVEDSGTVGLTGNNIPGTVVNQMMADGKVLPPEERLARFTSLFNSGGNTTGGGLYGEGKSVSRKQVFGKQPDPVVRALRIQGFDPAGRADLPGDLQYHTERF